MGLVVTTWADYNPCERLGVTSSQDCACVSIGTRTPCTPTISETRAMHDNERLRHEQVGQVVTEIMRLMQQHRDLELQTLHRTQVEQILDELNLPKDLLDDAVIELRRKEALAKARRRRILLTAAATVVVLALLGTAFWWTAHRRAIIARITAEQGRLTRQTDDGGTLRLIRRDGQEVVY